MWKYGQVNFYIVTTFCSEGADIWLVVYSQLIKCTVHAD